MEIEWKCLFLLANHQEASLRLVSDEDMLTILLEPQTIWILFIPQCVGPNEYYL